MGPDFTIPKLTSQEEKEFLSKHSKLGDGALSCYPLLQNLTTREGKNVRNCGPQRWEDGAEKTRFTENPVM